MTSLFHSLLTDFGPPPIPPVPPSYDAALLSPTGNAVANVATRQTALEPSTAGADHAFSFSIWMQPHNINLMTGTQRCFGVGETSSNTAQWSVNLIAQSSSILNQCLQFVIFGTSGSTNIQIVSTQRFWRARWTHLVGTYDGSESQSGFKLYINGREDTGATKSMGGSYVGAANSSSFRMMLSAITLGTQGRYGGRLKDLALWNAELSQAEVTSLYNANVPIDVDTLGFYGAKILAYWPFKTNINCLNNATFNLGTATDISHSTFPISTTYPFFGQFNAVPGNTRYITFGSCYQTSNYTWRIYQRSGTTHVANGRIDKITVNTAGYTPVVSSPTSVITNALDIRSAQAGVIAGSVYIFGSLYNGSVITDTVYWVSSDGEVGESFGSPVSVSSLLPSSSANTFGKMIEGPSAGEYMVPVYGSTGGTTYWGGYFKRDTGGTWSFVQMFSGTDTYSETCILNCGGGTFISLSRRNSGGNGLYMQSSTDNAVTWTSHASTGLGGGVCMADLCMTGGGKVCLIYADRSTGNINVSYSNNVADILADPTDWNAISTVFDSYAADSTTVLGYPTIQAWGSMAFACWAGEFSSSRADLFIGYGQSEY